jgi:hypothetical protein
MEVEIIVFIFVIINGSRRHGASQTLSSGFSSDVLSAFDGG